MDVNGTARNLQVGCWQCLLPLASDVGVGLGACSACAGEGDTTRCGRGRGGEECSQTVYKLRRISHFTSTCTCTVRSSADTNIIRSQLSICSFTVVVTNAEHS